MIAEYMAFVRHNQVPLRRLFLTCAALSALYYATWHFWRWSNAPGFVLLFGAMPWSLPAASFELRSAIGGPIMNFVSTLLISFGFGLNAALLASFVSFV